MSDIYDEIIKDQAGLVPLDNMNLRQSLNVMHKQFKDRFPSMGFSLTDEHFVAAVQLYQEDYKKFETTLEQSFREGVDRKEYMLRGVHDNAKGLIDALVSLKAKSFDSVLSERKYTPRDNGELFDETLEEYLKFTRKTLRQVRHDYTSQYPERRPIQNFQKIIEKHITDEVKKLRVASMKYLGYLTSDCYQFIKQTSKKNIASDWFKLRAHQFVDPQNSGKNIFEQFLDLQIKVFDSLVEGYEKVREKGTARQTTDGKFSPEFIRMFDRYAEDVVSKPGVPIHIDEIPHDMEKIVKSVGLKDEFSAWVEGAGKQYINSRNGSDDLDKRVLGEKGKELVDELTRHWGPFTGAAGLQGNDGLVKYWKAFQERFDVYKATKNSFSKLIEEVQGLRNELREHSTDERLSQASYTLADSERIQKHESFADNKVSQDVLEVKIVMLRNHVKNLNELRKELTHGKQLSPTQANTGSVKQGRGR